VFTRHQVEARVASGRALPHAVRFSLQAQLQAGWERLQALKRDLAQVLGAADLQLEENEGGWQLTVERDNNHPVDLLELFEGIVALPRLTAVLGVGDDGRPILINLTEPGMNHIMIAGGENAGKSSLLRSAAVSLALHNRQAHLQMMIIDPNQEITGQTGQSPLSPLVYLPHMLAPIVENLEEIAASLNWLMGEITYREEQRNRAPIIFLIVDNLHHLLAVGGQPILAPLTRIIQRGGRVGVHLAVSYQEGGAALPGLLQPYFTVRLVGKVDSPQQARAAAGVADSQADYLLGKGDFLAVNRGEILHFQAAYINNYDLHHTIDRLYRQPQRRGVAQPLNVRPAYNPASSDKTVRDFERDEWDRFSFDDR
jgi:DNA segregation ATPase FtsK/SpoIIIE-like protein